MPSKSAKQHRFMLAAAHNPSFARRAGIPTSVAQEFVQADASRSFTTRKAKRPMLKRGR